jgi:hypothetical protein
MTLKRYISSMSIMTVLIWSVFVYVLFIVDPETTNWVGFGLFYITLFVSLVGTASLIGFLIRFMALKQQLVWDAVKEAFRQSFLFALLIILSLILLSQDLFTWINIMLLVLGLSALEYFLLTLTKEDQ